MHEVTLMAPSYSVWLHHEERLRQLVSDVDTLGLWAQSALQALQRVRENSSRSVNGD